MALSSITPAGKIPAWFAGCLRKSSYLYDDKPGYPHRISQGASSQLNRYAATGRGMEQGSKRESLPAETTSVLNPLDL